MGSRPNVGFHTHESQQFSRKKEKQNKNKKTHFTRINFQQDILSALRRTISLYIDADIKTHVKLEMFHLIELHPYWGCVISETCYIQSALKRHHLLGQTSGLNCYIAFNTSPLFVNRKCHCRNHSCWFLRFPGPCFQLLIRLMVLHDIMVLRIFTLLSALAYRLAIG